MKSSFFKVIHHNLNDHVVTENERQISHQRTQQALFSGEQILQALKSNANGLTAEDIHKRLKEYGNNVVARDKPKSWFIQLLLAFKNPFNFVLILLALVSAITGDNTGMSIIMVMILISVVIKFTQEYKSGKSAELLKAMVHTTCSVTRINSNGQSIATDIAMEQLVPGDIVNLAAGDIIPADLRILHSKDLYISQATLTGEAMPVEKGDDINADHISENPLDLKNICFMGTNVNIGTATAVVLATGAKTYFGSMAATLTQDREITSFDIGINNVSWLLIRFMLVMVPVVFFISGMTKGGWLDSFLFALSVAVGLTPEMLPVVVTANLAKGATQMCKEQVIVKKLNAIQNFGAMNILCTDKTGTLTEDRIVLIKHLDVFSNDSQKVLQYAYLNSYFQSGLKNLMDAAILENKELADQNNICCTWQKRDEIPFDFNRRRMSVVIQQANDLPLIICKGAVEEMLACSTWVEIDGQQVGIDEQIKTEIQRNVARLNEDGLRVVAVGHRMLAQDEDNIYTVNDENHLILDGFVAFLDPPKASAKTALEALQSNGIQVKVLTGDNAIITRKVCQQVGLSDERVILGSELETLTDEQAIPLLTQHQLFAKLSPMQKARVVRLLRSQGHTVGYMGDGINDAPSLREADIGISVDTAVNIAKETADIILLQKSLLVLNDGVIEGRRTFANTIKYIKITASSNFGNVFSLLGASALFPFLPMLPLQILILNLIYDISQVSIPWDNVDKAFLSKPRKWQANDIKRFMLIIGPSSSIFDYATFAVLFFIFQANTVEHQALFQTGWFIESLITQTLVVQILRTEQIPFLQSQASRPVLITTAVLLIIGITLPYTALGTTVGFAKLPIEFYFWLAVIALSYCVLTQLLKNWYIRRFNSWL